ncbi:MAG TPA: SMC family ATPase [Patescibacteria group bacterium]|nr:SMC family ATPase [Patescibacteria group bacterium]
MIPTKLQLYNFTSFGTTMEPLDFSSFRLACLTGENGAGKSSLLDAMTYAVWGQARGRSSDELVRLGESEMHVIFEFELSGHLYRIQRGRDLRKNLTILELFLLSPSNANLTEGTLRDTQIKIDSLLKMSYETFVNSAYLKQGRADEFTLKGPTERKKILSDILGLGFYDELEEKAKDKTKETTLLLQNIELQLTEIEVELTEADLRREQLKTKKKTVQEIEKQIETIEQQKSSLGKEIQDLKVKSSFFEQKKSLIEKINGECDRLKQNIEKRSSQLTLWKSLVSRKKEIDRNWENLKGIQKQLEDFSKKQSQIIELNTKIVDLERVVASIKTENAQIQKEGEKIKQDLLSLSKDNPTCPLCGSELTKATHKTKVKKKLEDKLAELRESYKENSIRPELKTLARLIGQLREIGYDKNAHEALLKEKQKTSEYEKEKQEVDTAVTRIEAEEPIIKDEQERFAKLKQEEAKEKVFLQEAPQILSRLSRLKEEEESVLSKLTDLRTLEREERSLLGAAQQLVAHTEQLSKDKEKKIREKHDLLEKKQLLEELSLAFGKRGIQAMIIETAVPEIEEEANVLLEKMTDGRMSIALETQKETKTKKDLVETLEIVISDELGARSYELYSGGEAFRVNFSLRLALAKLLTRRAGTKLQFLVIDEGFGTQDQLGQERLIEAINSIQEEFEKILIVTHIESLKEAFPTRIEVIKKQTGSITQLIGS